MEKKEWFRVKEFVKGVGTTEPAFSRWLKMNPEFLERYCQNIGFGKKYSRYLILWEGVNAYKRLQRFKRKYTKRKF